VEVSTAAKSVKVPPTSMPTRKVACLVVTPMS
jgi:hypothetical protein